MGRSDTDISYRLRQLTLFVAGILRASGQRICSGGCGGTPRTASPGHCMQKVQVVPMMILVSCRWIFSSWLCWWAVRPGCHTGAAYWSTEWTKQVFTVRRPQKAIEVAKMIHHEKPLVEMWRSVCPVLGLLLLLLFLNVVLIVGQLGMSHQALWRWTPTQVCGRIWIMVDVGQDCDMFPCKNVNLYNNGNIFSIIFNIM